MKILIVGLNHKTAPVALREKVSPSTDLLGQRLEELFALEPVVEAMLLSTCNRFEAYCVCQSPGPTTNAIITWLAQCSHLDVNDLTSHLYVLQGEAAVVHGYRVAASLDSLVVGEAQILGQMKQAYQLAQEKGSIGAILNKYSHHLFRVAKQIRTETGISRNPVSIASVAVTLARKIFGSLEGNTCMLIGAGEMCELAAQHMVSHGVRILVGNRTLARAQALAENFEGEAFPLEDLEQYLPRADIVLSSTGSARPIVSVEMARAALRKRRQRSQFYIDIAVPRDIAPDVAKIDHVYLYDIDDLKEIADNNQKDRGKESEAAEKIIAANTPDFNRWLQTLDVVPTVVAMREKIERIKDLELEKVVKNWPNLADDDRQKIEAFARILVNKILHTPMKQLRELACNHDGRMMVDAARKLFELDEN